MSGGVPYIGVNLRPGRRYTAELSVLTEDGGRRLLYIGAFDTAEEAARAWDAAAIEHRGPLTSLNFPDEHPIPLPPPHGLPIPGVYLLHFSEPLGDLSRPFATASHYLGYADRISRRLWQHRRGYRYSRCSITGACRERGIGLRLARVWPDAGRQFERRLKNGGSLTRFCPICSGRDAWLRHRAPRADEFASGLLPFPDSTYVVPGYPSRRAA